MKRIPLSPYPGQLIVAKDWAEFREIFKEYTFDECDHGRADGTTIKLMSKQGTTHYLVHAKRESSRSTLAHELGHVVLFLFKDVGIDPADGGGEPFCYLLSHLMEEALKK